MWVFLFRDLKHSKEVSSEPRLKADQGPSVVMVWDAVTGVTSDSDSDYTSHAAEQGSHRHCYQGLRDWFKYKKLLYSNGI